MSGSVFAAEPYPLAFDARATALLIIDMQRDFLEPGGFGELLGNDVSLLRSTIEPCRAVLETARRRGLTVIHTREGHQADLLWGAMAAFMMDHKHNAAAFVALMAAVLTFFGFIHGPAVDWFVSPKVALAYLIVAELLWSFDRMESEPAESG